MPETNLFQPVGINEIAKNKGIHIYPNPNNGKFKIRLDDNTVNEKTIEVFNSLGKSVYRNPANLTDELKLDLPSGIYFITVSDSQQKSTGKIIIE